MSAYEEMITYLDSEQVQRQFDHLYGVDEGMRSLQTARYKELVKRHEKFFGNAAELHMISAPGRMEIRWAWLGSSSLA